jgi:hypothetical protein
VQPITELKKHGELCLACRDAQVARQAIHGCEPDAETLPAFPLRDLRVTDRCLSVRLGVCRLVAALPSLASSGETATASGFIRAAACCCF